MKQNPVILHGSAVSFGGKGAVFLRGPSGAGKSDLSFRLMHAGGILIADDQVAFTGGHGLVHAMPVAVTRGLIELRGVGLVRVPVAEDGAVRLVVDLVPRDRVPRMPEAETALIAGVAITRIALHAFDAATPFKIIKALEIVQDPSLLLG